MEPDQAAHKEARRAVLTNGDHELPITHMYACMSRLSI